VTVVITKIETILPNPNQPRKDFDPEKLQELADNIKAVGLKEPIEVRPLENGKYQIVDGERRWRASKLLLNLEEVPVRIREDIKTEEDAALQSYIINDQRSGYTPQDKEAYIHHLYETSGLSIRKLAAKLGVHHSLVDHYLEAYRFRQKLPPPTEVGTTLQLTHTALKNTAMIKDDTLRIRMLQALQSGKIKSSSEMLEMAKVLKDMPRPLWEAYFCDLIDWVTVVNSADWVNDYGADILGFFAKDIPLELKKDVINQWPLLQAAVVPDLLNWWIDKETENKHQFIELHIQLNPHKDAKYIRSYAERQIKKWQKEYKASVKDSLIRFKKKYQKDAEANKVGYSGTGFWVEVFYWIVNSIMVIQQTQHHLKEDDDIDTRIAIVDMLFTNEILLALRAGGGYEEGEKRLGKVQVPDDDYDDDDDEDPDELIKEEARNAKARAQHEEIRKRMLVEEGVVEEASA
jgi:ParB/RepB/Spo0J family partition protein